MAGGLFPSFKGKGGVVLLSGDERVAEAEGCASAGQLGMVPGEPNPSGQGYF